MRAARFPGGGFSEAGDADRGDAGGRGAVIQVGANVAAAMVGAVRGGLTPQSGNGPAVAA